jgi:hypothetical protein
VEGQSRDDGVRHAVARARWHIDERRHLRAVSGDVDAWMFGGSITAESDAGREPTVIVGGPSAERTRRFAALDGTPTRYGCLTRDLPSTFRAEFFCTRVAAFRTSEASERDRMWIFSSYSHARYRGKVPASALFAEKLLFSPLTLQ